MDYIEIPFVGKRHVLTEKIAVGNGRTACGRTISNGRTGGCIFPLIDCQRCVVIMRKNGWTR